MDGVRKAAEEFLPVYESIRRRDSSNLDKHWDQFSELFKKLQQFCETNRKNGAINDNITSTGVEQLADCFLEVCKWRQEVIPKEATLDETLDNPKNKDLSDYTRMVTSACIITSETFPMFCKYCIEKGVVDCVVLELSRPALLSQRYMRDCNKTQSSILSHLLMLLHNLLSMHKHTSRKFDSRHESVLKQYLEGDNYESKIIALFAVSYVQIKSDDSIQITIDLARNVLKWLQAAMKNDWGKLSFHFSVIEVLRSLSNLVNTNSACGKPLVEAGLLDYVDAILQAPYPQGSANDDSYEHKLPQDRDELVDYTTSLEKTLAVGLCSMLSFSEVTRSKLTGHGTWDTLKQISTDNGASVALQQNATELLQKLQNDQQRPQSSMGGQSLARNLESHVIKEGYCNPPKLAANFSRRDKDLRERELEQKREQKQKRDQEQERDTAKNKGPRIFVLYSKEQKELVLRIVDALRRQAFDNFITDLDAQGSRFTWTMDELEKADIVLLCYSKAFFDDVLCRKYSENAELLDKEIIPLQVEDYDAKSWLGGIVRRRTRRVFWDRSKFDASLHLLTEDINEKFKTEAATANEARPGEQATAEACTVL